MAFMFFKGREKLFSRADEKRVAGIKYQRFHFHALDAVFKKNPLPVKARVKPSDGWEETSSIEDFLVVRSSIHALDCHSGQ